MCLGDMCITWLCPDVAYVYFGVNFPFNVRDKFNFASWTFLFNLDKTFESLNSLLRPPCCWSSLILSPPYCALCLSGPNNLHSQRGEVWPSSCEGNTRCDHGLDAACTICHAPPQSWRFKTVRMFFNWSGYLTQNSYLHFELQIVIFTEVPLSFRLSSSHTLGFAISNVKCLYWSKQTKQKHEQQGEKMLLINSFQ